MGVLVLKGFAIHALMLLVWGLSCGGFWDLPFFRYMKTWLQIVYKEVLWATFQFLVGILKLELIVEEWTYQQLFFVLNVCPFFVYEILSFVFNIHSRSCNPVANCPHE
jgi:hypothetical protein